MRDIVVKKEFNIEIEAKDVLHLIQCYENSPIYNDVLKEYEGLKQKVYERLDLKAALCFTTIDSEYVSVLPMGSPVLYVIATVGDKVSELTRQLFKEDEYLKGMLVDAMTDAYLFVMESELKEWIKEECIQRKYGVSHRYEAPVNIPMEAQKIAYEATNVNKNLGITITSGYMFNPVKTNCQVLALTSDMNLFHLEHDCSQCDNTACNVRKVFKKDEKLEVPDRKVSALKETDLKNIDLKNIDLKDTDLKDTDLYITIVDAHKETVLKIKDGETLLDSLISNSINLNGVCNGSGTCGKCKIQLIEGEMDITASDKKHFSKDELLKGYRLACKARPNKHCKIRVSPIETSEFLVLSEYKEDKDKSLRHKESDENYSIAVDIGTTTLVISLVGQSSKSIIDTYTAVNGQRAFGADVISRIQASVNGRGEELRSRICKDLLIGFRNVISRNGIEQQKIKEIVISGNTTMGHLLMGFDCTKLGVFPFIPVDINLMNRHFCEVFMCNELDALVTFLPGISAFVGADIVSGLYFNGFHQSDHIKILIDLGTNGEMAIGNKYNIITTSTAAGPAFEGGNITWGVGSIKGAIANVEIKENKVTWQTLGNTEPIGICGTGIIEAVAEMVRNEIIDETGRMSEDYFDEGFPLARTSSDEIITVTQKDIRELQLAKSAIRAGVETLCLRYGVHYEQVDQVYLAGGFGVKLDQEKAIAVGLLPEAFKGKIEAVGNSSLGGGVKYLTNEDAKEQLKKLIQISSEINLANDLAFHDFYMKYMFFGEAE